MAKQTKKTVKKTVAKPAPVVMEHKCGNDCPCGCHKHSVGHRLKHILILVIVFILGFLCGCPMRGPVHFGPARGPFKHMGHPVFTNGCLDMKTIQSQKMQEVLMKADANGDNCVSVEEYKAFKAAKAEKFGKKPGFGPHFHGGKKGPQPQQQ